MNYREVALQMTFLVLHFAAVVHHSYRLVLAILGRPLPKGF